MKFYGPVGPDWFAVAMPLRDLVRRGIITEKEGGVLLEHRLLHARMGL